MIAKILLLGWVLVGGLGLAGAQDREFSDWPAGTSPQEVGKLLAEHFVTSPHQYTRTIHYSEVCTWHGALTFAELTHNDALRKELIAKKTIGVRNSPAMFSETKNIYRN